MFSHDSDDFNDDTAVLMVFKKVGTEMEIVNDGGFYLG